MDRYVEPNDNVIEQWAIDQDQADIKQIEAHNIAQQEAIAKAEEAKMAEIQKRLQEEEKVIEPVPLQIGQVHEPEKVVTPIQQQQKPDVVMQTE